MISTHKRKTRSSFIFFLILSLATAYTPQHAVAASIMPTAGAYHATPATHANTQSNYQATGFSAADYTSVATDDEDFLTTTATATAPQGEASFTTAGTYSWTAPAGVTSVSAVCVGGGAASDGYTGAGGGGLGWRNDISVSPGNSYTVAVGDRGYKAGGTTGYDAGGNSYFINTSTVRGGGAPASRSGGSYTGDGGGYGGNGSSSTGYGGGGGAGGYSGKGGNGGPTGSDGSGGGGAGGRDGGGSGGGGGVHLFGQGANGKANPNSGAYKGGGKGSYGDGRSYQNSSVGQSPGGGGGAANPVNPRWGGIGACRIIWGPNRAFPITNTGSLPALDGEDTYASQLYSFDTAAYGDLFGIKINLLAYGTANAGNGITAKIWNTNTAAWEELTGLSNTDSTMPTTIDTQNITENIQNYIDTNDEIKILIHTTNPSAGTTDAVLYTDYLNLTLLEQEITIQSPDSTKITSAADDGYFTTTGSIDNTTSTTTQVNVTLTQNGKEVIFPTNTTITEQSAGSFNFQNFTLEEQDIKNQQPTSRKAFRLGIQGEKLNFSQNITVNAYVGEAFNNQELDILYQQEGESTWNTQGTCTVQSGNCIFQTNHATIYTINGTLQATGDTPLNINTEVQDTLTLDCYDTDGGTGDFDTLLGTTSSPGLVTAGTPAVGQSTCDVTTNDDQGYYLSVVDDNAGTYSVLTHDDPNTAAVYEIQDLTHWDEGVLATENWSAPTTKGLGFSVVTFPDTTPTNNTFDGVWTETGSCPEGTNTDTNNYAGIPDTPEAIAAVPEYSANLTTTNICYKVDVPASQPSGIYTGSVTYTATSDASSYLN